MTGVTILQSTYSKIALAVLGMSAPTMGLACFDGMWYAVNYHNGVAYLAIAGIALVCAAVVQVLSNRFVWWVPVIVAAVAYALPTVELLRWGSGDCGMMFVTRTQFSVVVTGAYLIYAAVRLIRSRQTEGTD